MADADVPKNALDRLAAQSRDDAKSYQASADKLRTRADNWGNAVKALGLGAIAWVGFDTLTDVFPWRGDEGKWLAISAIALLSTLAVTTIFIGFRLTRQSRPLVTFLDIVQMREENHLSYRDVKLVNDIYADFLFLNTIESKRVRAAPPKWWFKQPCTQYRWLRARKKIQTAAVTATSRKMADFFKRAVVYERELERYYDPERRIDVIGETGPQQQQQQQVPADPQGDATKRQLDQDRINELKLSKASQIRADLSSTQWRACMLLVRRRVVRAISGPLTIAGLSLFAGALIALWYVSDAAHANRSENTDQIAYAKSCGEARKALSDGGAAVELPDGCDGAPGSGLETGSTESDVALANLVALSSDFATCQANAKVKDNEPATIANLEACRSIRASIDDQLTRIKPPF